MFVASGDGLALSFFIFSPLRLGAFTWELKNSRKGAKRKE